MADQKFQYHLIESEASSEKMQSPITSSGFRMSTAKVLSILLALSCIVNIGYLVTGTRPSAVPTSVPSKYAGLESTLLKPFEHTTVYSSENLTLAQEHWDALNFDTGVIYLSQALIESLQLPPAQPYPWETSHHVYLLNGYHNLHCVQSIELSVMDYHHGRKSRYPLQHIMHCLDALRDDVICHADDTPRYTTLTNTSESGVGQLRECRDWNQLENWAEKYSGCWKYMDESWDHQSELLRWMNCPPESPGYAKMQAYIESQRVNAGTTG